jgi:hypothetical protein
MLNDLKIIACSNKRKIPKRESQLIPSQISEVENDTHLHQEPQSSHLAAKQSACFKSYKFSSLYPGK